MESVLYAELTPDGFRQRIAAAPIAYLPLGTLEWHGEHLPLGADGLQSQGFFIRLAQEVGGIVLPMLFLGPDRRRETKGLELYGMDFFAGGREEQRYETQQLTGSAYWVSDDLFLAVLAAILKQLHRAGFRIAVAHGHGPSTHLFQSRIDEWRDRFELECFVCWGSEHDSEGLGIQVDHAAMNETSLVMALRPDLVHMERLPRNLAQWPVAIGGKDPRIHASAEVGERAIRLQTERMTGILRAALERL